ncbi:hypothetical protein ACOMHN_013825 [Nucella lapillus]
MALVHKQAKQSKAGFGSGGPASELPCACSSHRLHQWSHHAAVDAPRAPGLQAGWPQWPFTRLPGSAATSKTCGARGTAPRHVTHNFNTTKKKRNVPMGFARTSLQLFWSGLCGVWVNAQAHIQT